MTTQLLSDTSRNTMLAVGVVALGGATACYVWSLKDKFTYGLLGLGTGLAVGAYFGASYPDNLDGYKNAAGHVADTVQRTTRRLGNRAVDAAGKLRK